MKNKRKIAEKLEHLLEQEFHKNLPIAVLPNKIVLYKNYKIKPAVNGSFSLCFGGRNFEEIAQFNLKACALMAAKKHDRCQLEAFKEIAELDRKYWVNYTDTKYYEEKIRKTKDFERYCILTSRLDLSRQRAVDYKDKIQRMFTTSFV